MSQNVAVPVSDRVDNVRHTSGYFLSKTLQQRTYMNKARPKYPTDLNGNICIDNIQKAVVICLIITTTFPLDAESITIQVCRVLWSGFYHTGSLLK